MDEHGVVHLSHVRQLFPLFSVRIPIEHPVTVKRQPRVAYPIDVSELGISGYLIMQFVVDTTGRAEMSTVKDLWPSNLPRLTGAKADYYNSFRKAVIAALPDARFEPARIGVCKVKQFVQTPFEFRIRQ